MSARSAIGKARHSLHSNREGRVKLARSARPEMLLAMLVLGQLRAISAAEPAPLRISWADNLLSIEAAPGQPEIPGEKLIVNSLEAYCRPGSSDRDWSETVIGHETRLVSADRDGRALELECRLRDGVIVRHKIIAGADEVALQLTAHNPTAIASQADWAQPCIRVGPFTGKSQDDYLPQCFVLVEGKVTRLPTTPWATKARYVPGQVYCPLGVDRGDVNPRPLSPIVPSHGLIGCFSADGRWIMASAWQPYQELFQGVITCVHSDFRLSGLKPGETKQIRGKIYVTRESIESLVRRYERDFAEHLVPARQP
jgi:hypothetical protein